MYNLWIIYMYISIFGWAIMYSWFGREFVCLLLGDVLVLERSGCMVYLNDVIHTDMQKYYNKEKVWYVPPVFFDGCLYISYIVVYDNVLWI